MEYSVDFSKKRLLEHHNAVFNDWDKNYSGLIKEVFDSENINSYLDLGANTGPVVEFLCKYFNENIKLICFEPAIENFNFLKERIELIKKIKNPILIQKAVFYGIKQSVAYGVGDNNTGGLFLGDTLPDVNPNDHRKPVTTSITFECSTLEEELNKIESIDLCKIDVEGSEYNILRNSKFIKEKVNNILLEYHWKTEPQIIEWISENVSSHEIIKTVRDTVWLRKIK